MNVIQQRIAAVLLVLSTSGALGIIAHEGMRKVAYVDPVGVVTVCAGHTKTAKLGQVKTDAECAVLLQSDVKTSEAAVKRLVKIKLTQGQFDSLVSFVFNVGEPNFAKSTLLRKINEEDCLSAAAEFSRWTKAGGRELPGLVIRRAAERKQFEKGCPSAKHYKRTDRVNVHSAQGVYAQYRPSARRPEPHAFAVLAWQA